MLVHTKCPLSAMLKLLMLVLVGPTCATTTQEAHQKAVIQLITSALHEMSVSTSKALVTVHGFGNDLTATINTLGAQVDATGPVYEFAIIIRFLAYRFMQKRQLVFHNIRSTYSQILNSISDRVQLLDGQSGVELMASLARTVDNHEDEYLRVILHSNAQIRSIVNGKIATILRLQDETQDLATLKDVLRRYSAAVKQLVSEILAALVACNSRLDVVSDRAAKDILLMVNKLVSS